MGDAKLTGCDSFIEDDIVYENGVHIYKREIHEMTGQFDGIILIILLSTLQTRMKQWQILKDYYLPTGCQNQNTFYPNIAFDMYGADWFQIDAPRHIFLHTKHSWSIWQRNMDSQLLKDNMIREQSRLSSVIYILSVSLFGSRPEK